jgi:hypothetical protein
METTTDEMCDKVAGAILDQAMANHPDSTPEGALRAFLDAEIAGKAQRSTLSEPHLLDAAALQTWAFTDDARVTARGILDTAEWVADETAFPLGACVIAVVERLAAERRPHEVAL